MFSSRKILFCWIVFGGGATVVGWIAAVGVAIVLLVIVFTSAFAHGGGPGAQAASVSDVSTVDIKISQEWTGQKNQGVVDMALSLASYLYVCGPDNRDECWHNGFPQQAVNYMNAACGNCWEAQNGQLQCVLFVAAVYGLAGQDLPIAHDAHLFWPDYANRPGWNRISNTSMPYPGDIIVWEGPTATAAGHVAIVVDVNPPQNGAAGYIQFVEANGPGPIVQQILVQDNQGLHVRTWDKYTIDGYIRHQDALR